MNNVSPNQRPIDRLERPLCRCYCRDRELCNRILERYKLEKKGGLAGSRIVTNSERVMRPKSFVTGLNCYEHHIRSQLVAASYRVTTTHHHEEQTLLFLPVCHVSPPHKSEANIRIHVLSRLRLAK